MSSRLEINLRRLLERCELMSGEMKNGDWRLEKYVGALEEQLNDLKKSPSQPSVDTLGEYNQRLVFIKGLLEAERLPSATHKVLATELLTPISHGAHSTQVKEVHMKVKVRHQADMRAELLGTAHDNVSDGVGGLRHRLSEDIDTVLQHHHQLQEKLADEMVMLARNLKDNASAAGDIVRRDTQKLQESTKLADSNYVKLKVESGRLSSYTKTCNWWVWLLLAAVIATFLWMIVFMKMFKKGRT